MTEAKKYQCLFLLPLLVSILCVLMLAAFGLHEYRQAVFSQVSAFSQIVLESEPESEEKLLAVLKEYQAQDAQSIRGSTFLEQYGYTADHFGGKTGSRILFSALTAILAMTAAFVFAMRSISQRYRSRLAELTLYLEQVNTGKTGTIIQTKEDGFSHLQDEMYKTVTALYQTREAAIAAKMNFADNLANIAHQLKTPITAAFLSLQLMEKEGPSHYSNQIKRQLNRLNRLEESLLTLSKIDAGTLPFEYSRVDLYTALSLAAENLADLLSKEKVSVYIPDRGCVEITGDLEWTMEALMNLMKNSMEHSPQGGTIHCDYSENPLYAEIRIWDEGEGFAPEDLPHLFERFYRGKNAAGNGIGIGLALARSIFELQNGNITARNLPEGGACFEIRVYCH